MCEQRKPDDELGPNVYLGQKEQGVPEFGIFVDKKKTWCKKIYTNRDKRISNIVEERKKKWNVFNTIDGFENVPNNTKEHYNHVIFDINSNAKENEDYEFGFYINNTESSQCCLASIYSVQERKSTFHSFIVRPRDKKNLLRYENEDKAYCLSKNKVKADMNYSSDEKKFNEVSKDDVCSFMIFVTQVEEIDSDEADEIQWDCDEDDVEFDFDETDSCDLSCDSSQNSLKVQADSSYNYMNVIRGKKTNQDFVECKVRYTGAPINIYHVFFLCKSS